MAWSHPELKEGEVYLCNDTTEGFEEIGWKTKRLGEVPYIIDHHPHPVTDFHHPVFVQQSELETARVRV